MNTVQRYVVLNKVGKWIYGVLLFSKNSHNTYVRRYTYTGMYIKKIICSVTCYDSLLIWSLGIFKEFIYRTYERTEPTYVDTMYCSLKCVTLLFYSTRECITILSLERVIKYEKSSRYRRFQYFSPALSGIRTVRYYYTTSTGTIWYNVLFRSFNFLLLNTIKIELLLIIYF